MGNKSFGRKPIQTLCRGKPPKEEIDIVMDRESKAEFTKFSRICLHEVEIRIPLVKIKGLDLQFLKRMSNEMGLLMPSSSSEK